MAPPAGAETLRLVHWPPPQHILTPSTLGPLVGGVEGAEIEVNPSGDHKAGPLGQYDRVVQGDVAIVWRVPGYTPAQFPRAMVAELPGAVPEGVAGEDLLWNAHDGGLLDAEFLATNPRARLPALLGTLGRVTQVSLVLPGTTIT